MPAKSELDRICTALRAVRERAGLSKQDLRIGLDDSVKRPRVIAHGERGGDHAHLSVRTRDEVLDSFHDPEQEFWTHAIWRGENPDDLRRWFKEAHGESAEPKKKPAPAGNRAGAEGGWFKVYNVLVDTGLLGAMPLPALRAYLTCSRYAGPAGDFFISHATLAEKIGCRNRTKGADAMKRLLSAGLVQIERRGNSAGRATDYRLAILTPETIERACRVFNVYPAQGTGVPRGGVQSVPRVGDTTQTYHSGEATQTRARSERARSRNEKSAPSALSTQQVDR
jgi:hypothetical protein